MQPSGHGALQPDAPAQAPPLADRGYLLTEFSILFFGLPLIIALGERTPPFWILLYSAGALCAAMLLLDRRFDRRALWNAPGARQGLLPALALWAFGAFVLSWIVRSLAPQQWLAFPRERPGMWALVMVAYPVLSVYVQNIIYRAFIFHRYRGLFPAPGAMVWASALAFAWAHIIFHNTIALLLTLAGGLIFARTYQRHQSLLLCSIEHALYGCLIFTIGLGYTLYLNS